MLLFTFTVATYRRLAFLSLSFHLKAALKLVVWGGVIILCLYRRELLMTISSKRVLIFRHVTHVVGIGPFFWHLILFLKIFAYITVTDELSDAKLAADCSGTGTCLWRDKAWNLAWFQMVNNVPITLVMIWVLVAAIKAILWCILVLIKLMRVGHSFILTL